MVYGLKNRYPEFPPEEQQGGPQMGPIKKQSFTRGLLNTCRQEFDEMDKFMERKDIDDIDKNRKRKESMNNMKFIQHLYLPTS